MPTAPFLNRSHFEHAIEELIQRAVAQNRGADLTNLISNLKNRPENMSKLSSLMFMIDEDYRTELNNDIHAFQRFSAKKGKALSDDDVFEVLLTVYKRHF